MSEQAKGASKALNKTISAVMQHLEDDGDRPQSELREFLYEKLGDLAVYWYRRGFRRGHREAHRQSRNGNVTRVLRRIITREFFTGNERTIRLRSRLS